MKQSISSYDFHRAFEQQRPDNFSYDGLNVLFEYFEELEDDTGEEMELDVIAICCDYSEDNPLSVFDNYGVESLEELRENTMVLTVNDETIIYQLY